jgi:hypothetical protein
LLAQPLGRPALAGAQPFEAVVHASREQATLDEIVRDPQLVGGGADVVHVRSAQGDFLQDGGQFGAMLGDLAGQAERRRPQLADRDDLVNQPDPEGLVRVDRVAGEEHPAGPLGVGFPEHAVVEAVHRVLDLGGTEGGVL